MLIELKKYKPFQTYLVSYADIQRIYIPTHEKASIYR
jgi:hypothetical protein